MKRLLIALAFAALGLAGITLGQVTTNPGETGLAASRGQLPGEPSNGTACAGCVGELISNSATSTAVSMTNDTPVNLTSVSLTPGDWDVSGMGMYAGGATTIVSYIDTGISTTSATVGGAGSFSILTMGSGQTSFVLNDVNTVAPTVRVSLAATTTVFMVGIGHFSTSTMTGGGFIRARRMR